jgi:predicted DNA-binding mobile mystery protein A
MRKLGSEEGLRALNEAGMAFGVLQEKAVKVQGWLRTVRRELGISAPEMARRVGKSRPEVFRTEHAEEQGGITLRTLRRAAEALGCDLVYGLAPKEGTLAAMAAGREAAREQRRTETLERRDERKRDRRREAARVRWAAEEQARLEEEWREYWRQCRMRRTEGARKLIPKPKPRVQLWKQELRKALARVLRKQGSRIR